MKVVFVYVDEMPSYQGTPMNPDIKKLTDEFRASVMVEKDGAIYTVGLVLGKGMKFDGASIPRAFWRVCGHPFQSPRDAAACLHDWLYASHYFPRDLADEIYFQALLSLGVPKWKARVEWSALRTFGWWNWRVSDEERNDAQEIAKTLVDLREFDATVFETIDEVIEEIMWRRCTFVP